MYREHISYVEKAPPPYAAMSPHDRVIIMLLSRQIIIRVHASVLPQPQKLWVFHGVAY